MPQKRKFSDDKTYRRKAFADPIFHSEIYLCTGPDFKWALDSFCKYFAFSVDDFSWAKVSEVTHGCLCCPRGSKTMLLWFKDHVPRPAVVAHEITHAALNVAEVLGGMELSVDNEFICYYHEWLTRQVTRVLW